MKRCYEFFVLGVKHINEAEGRLLSSDLVTEVDSDTCDIIDEILQKYGRNSWEFFENTDITLRKEGICPWAIVLFEEEFQLSGHAVSIREDRKHFWFTSYSMKPWLLKETGVPPLSVILVFSKKALKDAALKSELFNKAWEQLSECSEERHWICIADSPSPEWISQTSKNDMELFIKKVCI
jgi:hypothetical protein